MRDQAFPYQVAISVPEPGLGDVLVEMNEFCAALPHRRRASRELGRDELVWCFERRGEAILFQGFFGGRYIELVSDNDR